MIDVLYLFDSIWDQTISLDKMIEAWLAFMDYSYGFFGNTVT
jgi:hypothetical protein